LPLNRTVPVSELSFIDMNPHRCAAAIRIGTVISLFIGQHAFGQRPSTAAANQILEPVAAKTDLYPADADARKEIEEALRQATTEQKRVLLVFGANWCYDCHVLDRALHEGVAGNIVARHFLLVHVDIGEGEKNPDLLKTYKIPLDKGVPAVAVLSAKGNLLYSSGQGEFEAARRMMKKDLVAFLQHWKTR
jgi:thiol:disulfide interchange protein